MGSVAASTLDDLISPLSVSSFFADVWEQRPRCFAPTPSRAALVTVDDVDAAMCRWHRWLPASHLRVKRDGGRQLVDAREYSVPGSFGDVVVDMDLIFKLFEDGCTVVVLAVDRTFDALYHLSRNVEATVRSRVACNLYMSRDGVASAPLHEDDHDVFAIQVAGAKTWNIVGLEPHRLTAGEMAYIPQFGPHGTATDAEASIHVTLGCSPVTALVVLDSFRHVHLEKMKFLRQRGAASGVDRIGAMLASLDASGVEAGIQQGIADDGGALLRGRLGRLFPQAPVK